MRLRTRRCMRCAQVPSPPQVASSKPPPFRTLTCSRAPNSSISILPCLAGFPKIRLPRSASRRDRQFRSGREELLGLHEGFVRQPRATRSDSNLRIRKGTESISAKRPITNGVILPRQAGRPRGTCSYLIAFKPAEKIQHYARMGRRRIRWRDYKQLFLDSRFEVQNP